MTPKEAVEALIRIAKQSSGNEDYHNQLKKIYETALSTFDKKKEE